MDEGKLHDRLAKEGDFSNALVIFTSNVGSEWLIEQINNGNMPATNRLMEVMGRYFRPEFLACLSEIVPFAPINESMLLKIFNIRLKTLNTALEKQGITIEIDEDTRRMPAQKGFTAKYGARQVAGIIRNRLRRPISRYIISGKLVKGSILNISMDDEQELVWDIK
jgi:ATP-dependent Clp protease ATP-binding subunit ClpA